jgi:hypothetical protein
MFRDVNGKPFWSLGVTCVGTGPKPSEVKPENPEYAAFRLFPNDRAWAVDTIAKLKSYGINSLGGWCDNDKLNLVPVASRMPYFVVLHLGAYYRAPWDDLFSDDATKAMEKAAADQISKLRDDPNLVGYFTDNELGWWREAVFSNYIGLPAKSPGKKRIIAFLRRHYRDNFELLKRDFDTSATSFVDLDASAKLLPGRQGMKPVIGWLTEITTYYYKTVRDLVKKYDSKRLIMGDRYAQFYYPNVAKVASKYVDVISTNYGSEWNTGENSRSFLDSLYAITKKPILITEFYMAAMENRSGNKNSSGGFPVVETQQQRAVAVSRYLADLGSRPYVVGAHWFQFTDEPTHGRGDGENYNMGLLDIHGVPYDGTVEAFRQFRTSPPIGYGSSTVPRAPDGAEKGLRDWDKRNGFVKPTNVDKPADLYLAKSGNRLLVGLHVMDFMDGKIFKGGKVPDQDLPTLTIVVNGNRYTVRYGGEKASVTGGASAVQTVGVKSEVIVSVPLPAGKVDLKAELVFEGRTSKARWVWR